MKNSKPWWKSKAVWGGIIALVAGIAGAFGFSVGAEDQQIIVDAVLAIVAGAGGLLAVYGRIKADKRVGNK